MAERETLEVLSGPGGCVCPTCGQAVTVESSDEGTAYFGRAAEARIAELEAALRLIAADTHDGIVAHRARLALKGKSAK